MNVPGSQRMEQSAGAPADGCLAVGMDERREHAERGGSTRPLSEASGSRCRARRRSRGMSVTVEALAHARLRAWRAVCAGPAVIACVWFAVVCARARDDLGSRRHPPSDAGGGLGARPAWARGGGARLRRDAQRRRAARLRGDRLPRCPDPDVRVAFEEQADVVIVRMAGTEIALDVRDALEEVRPNLAVVDCMLPAAIAAARAKDTPTASIVHFLYGLARSQMLRTGGGWTTDLRSLARTHRALGLTPAAEGLAAWEAPELVLVTAPRWVDIECDTAGERPACRTAVGRSRSRAAGRCRGHAAPGSADVQHYRDGRAASTDRPGLRGGRRSGCGCCPHARSGGRARLGARP